MRESAGSERIPEGLEAPACAARDLAEVLENRGRWLATVVRLVGDRHAANDVLQNACINALLRSDSLRDRARFSAWFRSVLVNAALDYGRRDHAYRRALSQYAAETTWSSSSVEEEAHDFHCDCVSQVLSTLRPVYASVLQMVDIEGGSLDEVAKRSGITTTNARVRLHRARNAFRNRLLVACEGMPHDRCQPCRCEPESRCRRVRRLYDDATTGVCNGGRRRASK